MPVLPFHPSESAEPKPTTALLILRRQIVEGVKDALSRLANNQTPHSQHTVQSRNRDVVAIPTVYDTSGPSPGAVVGIVLGSVLGFILLLLLLWFATNGGGFIASRQVVEERREVRSRGSRSRRSRRTEMRSRTPPTPRRDRIIRTERIIRDGPLPPRESSRIREIYVEDDELSERRVEGDDVVEVIEEHSSIVVPEPKRKSRRSSGYR